MWLLRSPAHSFLFVIFFIVWLLCRVLCCFYFGSVLFFKIARTCILEKCPWKNLCAYAHGLHVRYAKYFQTKYYLSQRNHLLRQETVYGQHNQCRGYRGLYLAGNPRLVCSVSNLEKGEKKSQRWWFGRDMFSSQISFLHLSFWRNLITYWDLLLS